MKTVVLTLACVLALGCLAQSQDLRLYKSNGTRQLTLDAAGDPNRSPPRYGRSIWNNFAACNGGWFSSMTAHYIWLDWGKLIDQGNGLPDEVVDGFRFAYGIYGTWTTGLSFNMYYYDSCTGWGDYSTVLEAGFSFTDLPDTGNLPPGFWTWEITVDLEGSGFEFLMGEEIGIGQQLATEQAISGPCFAKPPNCGGNGNTMTEDAIDILYPDGSHEGTYWFGGYPASPYCSFRNELLGGRDPAVNLSYGGIGLQGNEASLYCTGSWTAGDTVRFLLRRNGLKQAGSVVASTGLHWPPFYIPSHDITLGPRMPFLAVLPLMPSPVGDFDAGGIAVTPQMESLTLYMQGAITDMFIGGPVDPVDLSNGIF